MIINRANEQNWYFPILDKIDFLCKNLPEISKLMAIAKKSCYLTGNTEAVLNLLDAENMQDELSRMYKSVERELMEINNLERADSGLPGNMTIAYLEGARDTVNRLTNTNSIETELRKIKMELQNEWVLIDDSLLKVLFMK